jgi:hypothetical protein
MIIGFGTLTLWDDYVQLWSLIDAEHFDPTTTEPNDIVLTHQLQFHGGVGSFVSEKSMAIMVPIKSGPHVHEIGLRAARSRRRAKLECLIVRYLG